jgi:hypothetical protein
VCIRSLVVGLPTPTVQKVGSYGVIFSRLYIRHRQHWFGLVWFGLVWFGFFMSSGKTGVDRQITVDLVRVLEFSAHIGRIRNDSIMVTKEGFRNCTLAYLLPLLRHILVQPPLEPNESGPIGLILAPARELAFQIHSVCKVFTKQFGVDSSKYTPPLL